MKAPSAADNRFRDGLAHMSAGRWDVAFECFTQAASDGHGLSALELGRMHLHGLGRPAAAAQALPWILVAERRGIPEASALLAQIALGNRRLRRDFGMIQRALASAAGQGHAASRRAIAILGLGPGLIDPAARVRALQQCAAAGDGFSARLIERVQDQGLYGDRDPAFAMPPRPGSSGAATSGNWPPALPTVSTLHQSPRVQLVEGVLSPLECAYVITLAENLVEPSLIYNPRTQRPEPHPVRTSDGGRVESWQEDVVLRYLQYRLAAVASCELHQAEPLAILRYRAGQEYRPHWDFLPPEALATRQPEAGQRQRTVCCYLNAVEQGGQTEFPRINISVQPQTGSAVIFDNLDHDGQPETDSEHAGRPVSAGEKWLATLWFRQGPIRDH